MNITKKRLMKIIQSKKQQTKKNISVNKKNFANYKKNKLNNSSEKNRKNIGGLINDLKTKTIKMIKYYDN